MRGRDGYNYPLAVWPRYAAPGIRARLDFGYRLILRVHGDRPYFNYIKISFGKQT